MAYNILKSDGTPLIQSGLADGIVDNTTSLNLIGRNTTNFGISQNDNFLWLLENFANSTPPSRPIVGQVWFDKSVDKLKLNVYDGTVWKSAPSLQYSNTATNQTLGDFWYDTGANQLSIKTESGYLAIGPANNAASAGKLSQAVTINGVSFDGSTSITITASTTGELSRGQYLTGDNFNGSNSTSWAVDVGNVSNADPSKVVARDSIGDIWYNTGHGESTTARYADLAEKYLADKDYEPGTVMMIGGPAEVTQSGFAARAIGVVSTNPAYMMNSELQGGTYIALKGRVPVKVYGPISKGDDLVAHNFGHAISINVDGDPTKVFAVALEDFNDTEGVIEALIL
jgi:hypothetical protein